MKLTSAEKSPTPLWRFSWREPGGPGLVNLLPWFHLMGLRMARPCLRWADAGVGVIISPQCIRARNLQQNESSGRWLDLTRSTKWLESLHSVEETWDCLHPDWLSVDLQNTQIYSNYISIIIDNEKLSLFTDKVNLSNKQRRHVKYVEDIARWDPSKTDKTLSLSPLQTCSHRSHKQHFFPQLLGEIWNTKCQIYLMTWSLSKHLTGKTRYVWIKFDLRSHTDVQLDKWECVYYKDADVDMMQTNTMDRNINITYDELTLLVYIYSHNVTVSQCHTLTPGHIKNTWWYDNTVKLDFYMD